MKEKLIEALGKAIETLVGGSHRPRLQPIPVRVKQ